MRACVRACVVLFLCSHAPTILAEVLSCYDDDCVKVSSCTRRLLLDFAANNFGRTDPT